MKVEPTVLVVSRGDAPAQLLAALAQQGVIARFAAPEVVHQALAGVLPDLVVGLGAGDAGRLTNAVRSSGPSRGARVVIIADRGQLETLRRLDRELLVAILPSDASVAALASRVAALARQAAAHQPRAPDLLLPPRAVEAAKWLRVGRAHRVVVADDDVTRGFLIAQALIQRGLEVQVVPLDPARTRWTQLQAHSPEVLIVDAEAAAGPRRVWLELFQADALLRSARVVKLRLASLFDEATMQVSLTPLEPHIHTLSRWRNEMPTVIEDDDRPTLMLGEDQPDSYPFELGSEDAASDFDDRPTIARAPEEPERPLVLLADSVIVESRRFTSNLPPTHGQTFPSALSVAARGSFAKAAACWRARSACRTYH